MIDKPKRLDDAAKQTDLVARFDATLGEQRTENLYPCDFVLSQVSRGRMPRMRDKVLLDKSCVSQQILVTYARA